VQSNGMRVLRLASCCATRCNCFGCGDAPSGSTSTSAAAASARIDLGRSEKSEEARRAPRGLLGPGAGTVSDSSLCITEEIGLAKYDHRLKMSAH